MRTATYEGYSPRRGRPEADPDGGKGVEPVEADPLEADPGEGDLGAPAPAKGRDALPRAFRIAVLAELVVGALLRGRLLTRPIAVLDRLVVPDDTYYTLTIARSLAAGHGPTVDGHTLTSGFQPLIAFLVTPMFWLTHDPDKALRADIGLLLICDLAIILLLAHIAHRLAGPLAAVVAAGVWAVSPMALVMAAGGLETTLAMLCELGLVAAALAAVRHPTPVRYAVVGATAALAVLARVDAAILVALIAAVLVWRTPAAARVRLVGASALVGALVLAPWWGYCLLRFGSPIPGSGAAARTIQGYRVDAFGRGALAYVGSSALAGPFGPWTDRRTQVVTDLARWPFVVVAVASLVFAGAYLWPRRWRGASGEDERIRTGCRNVVGAAALFVPALMGFYAWYEVRYFDYRYLAPVAPAVTLVLAAVIGPMLGWFAAAVTTRRVAWPGTTRVLGAMAALALVAWAGPSAAAATASLMSSEEAYAGLPHPKDSRVGYRAQALAVDRVLPRGVVMGSNQSGALGYFAGRDRTVINLDGVVNPDAAAASKKKHKAAYLRSTGARYMVDWPLFHIHVFYQAANGGFPVRMSRVVGVPSARLPELVVSQLAWPDDPPPPPARDDELPVEE